MKPTAFGRDQIRANPYEKNKWKIFDERGYLQYMCAVLFEEIR